jgi:hypothetical protein
MKVILTTAVWGAWHIDAYLRVTLPTLLAHENLPALARDHSCTYRLFTTTMSRGRLESAPGIAQLRRLMVVDIEEIASDDRLASDFHLAVWQKVVDEAVEKNSAVVSLHPDTPWSNGSFAFMSRGLTEGKEVFIVPNVRVVSETFLPALEAARRGEAIALSGDSMSALALRHFHPLSGAMVPQIGYSATATEIYWGVKGKGLSLRHASRPAIAAIPRAVPLDIEFYTRKINNMNGVFNVTDVNQMFMLSLAPLFKDFGLITPEHKVTPLLVGRWCAHPQNDTPLKDYFAAQSLRMPLGPDKDGPEWEKGAREGDEFMNEVSVHLAAVNLHYAMRAQGCWAAAGVLAMALHETDLAKKVRCPALGQEGVALVPSEAAFKQFGKEKLEKLLAPGSEAQLLDFMLSHYRPDWNRKRAEREMAEAGITVTATASTDRLAVMVIDRVMAAETVN